MYMHGSEVHFSDKNAWFFCLFRGGVYFLVFSASLLPIIVIVTLTLMFVHDVLWVKGQSSIPVQ